MSHYQSTLYFKYTSHISGGLYIKVVSFSISNISYYDYEMSILEKSISFLDILPKSHSFIQLLSKINKFSIFRSQY